jgi:ABC-type transporter MlaC component
LWDKHFGDTPSVNLSDDRVKPFFEELNEICENDYAEEIKTAKDHNSEIKKYRTQND